MLNIFKIKRGKRAEKELPCDENYNNIELISKYIYDEVGIIFDNQINILRSKTVLFCRERKICSFDSLLMLIKTNAELKQEVVNFLTTNETYFNREMHQINKLVDTIAKMKNKVKILCAPSASGEEVYTIIIALLEKGVLPSAFDIVGIDINSNAILKANQAIYNKRSVRNLSSQMLIRYFTNKDGEYALKNNIKSLASFKLANIFDAKFKDIGRFDFVFSRNMLIYFDKETKEKARKVLESVRTDTKNEIFFGHADLF